MRSRAMRSLLIIATTLLTISGHSGGVAASSTVSTPEASPADHPQPVFSMVPISEDQRYNFDVEIEPGKSMTLTAGVMNTGEVPVELRAYATNAVTIINGGFGAASEDTKPIGATAWLDYIAATIKLNPDEMWQQEFTITVPSDAAPGEYVTALVAQTVDSLPIQGTENFRQILRSAMRVVIHVPGPTISEFTLGEPTINAEASSVALDIPITNSGNATLEPAGEMVIADKDGEKVASSSIEMGSVFAGDSTLIRIPIPEQFPDGEYLVSLDLTDEATGASDSIEDAPITLEAPKAEEKSTFEINEASVTPNGDPVQYADVVATITNNGPAIPTANVTLNVMRDGETVESYPLAEGKALPQGTTDFSQRYIPVDGWKKGTYTFELVISAISGDTETVLATVEIPDEIVVP